MRKLLLANISRKNQSQNCSLGSSIAFVVALYACNFQVVAVVRNSVHDLGQLIKRIMTLGIALWD